MKNFKEKEIKPLQENVKKHKGVRQKWGKLMVEIWDTRKKSRDYIEKFDTLEEAILINDKKVIGMRCVDVVTTFLKPLPKYIKTKINFINH